jgi:hypothetical protein
MFSTHVKVYCLEQQLKSIGTEEEKKLKHHWNLIDLKRRREVEWDSKKGFGGIEKHGVIGFLIRLLTQPKPRIKITKA